MFNLDSWLDEYVSAVDEAFGTRIVFIGLQGSYARGEAHEGSDIDVVLLLDELHIEDLKVYRNAIASLPERDKICGFLSGIAELTSWDRADLFQFYHDTKAIYGDLDFLAPLLTPHAVKRAAQTAACNVYHAFVHNFVHEQSEEVLRGLCKAAVFALQAKHYLENGAYISRKKDLLAKLSGTDYEVLQFALLRQYNLQKTTQLLLEWSAQIIKEYGSEEDAETAD